MTETALRLGVGGERRGALGTACVPSPVSGSEDLLLVSKASGKAVSLTGSSFGRLCQYAKAPADYLRTLPAAKTAELVNFGLRRYADRNFDERVLLVAKRSTDVLPTLYGVTSAKRHELVWDADWLEAIDRHLVKGLGFKVPPARPYRDGQARTRKATAEDVVEGMAGGVQVKVGDDIAPAGVYLNEEGSFVLLIHPTFKAWDGENELMPMLMLSNNQVGKGSVWGMRALCNGICGNHIVWGATCIAEFSVAHRKGQTAGIVLAHGLAQVAELVENTRGFRDDFTDACNKARRLYLGDDKDSAVEKAFEYARAKRLNLVTREKLETAFDVTEQTPIYGNPTSVWGFVQGLTDGRTSQRGKTQARIEYDSHVGRFMDLVEA